MKIFLHGPELQPMGIVKEKAEPKTGAQRQREIKARQTEAARLLGYAGIADVVNIILGMNADQLAMFIAWLEDAEADGGK